MPADVPFLGDISLLHIDGACQQHITLRLHRVAAGTIDLGSGMAAFDLTPLSAAGKASGADERQYSTGKEVLTSNSLSSSSSFACRLESNCAMVLRVCVPQAARAGVGRVDGGFWWT